MLEDKKIHAFLKVICLKVNVIVRLEFEIAYYGPIVHYVNHNATTEQCFPRSMITL